MRFFSTASDASLSAFIARTGLKLSNPDLLKEALVHRSAAGSLELQHGRLHLLGSSLIKFRTTDFILKKYPELPYDSCTTLVKTLTNQHALSEVGKSFGVPSVMKWKSSKEGGESVVTSWIVQSLVGALYLDKGLTVANQFISSHILTRSVDIQNVVDMHIKLRHPKTLLMKLMKKKQLPSPIARLLKETGRLSSQPVFIVGIYSGVEKIGEGYGNSLQMAESRAVRDALLNHYTEEMKDIDIEGEKEEEISFLQ